MTTAQDGLFERKSTEKRNFESPLSLIELDINPPEENLPTKIAITIDPSQTYVGPNIRDKDDQHIEDLARSIIQNSQLQPCIADFLDYQKVKELFLESGMDDFRSFIDSYPNKKELGIRIWAGQHRRLAILSINEARKQKIGIDLSLYRGTLTPAQAIRIQAAENLQAKMKPEEEAQAIMDMFLLYIQASNKQPSYSELARITGANPKKIADAITFFTRIDPRLQEMVLKNSLSYTFVLLFKDFDPIKREGDVSKQFRQALIHTQLNLPIGILRERIQNILNDSGSDVGLFDGDTEIQLKQTEKKLSFTNQAARAAGDAAGYFERILAFTKMLPEDHPLLMTDTIEDVVVSLIVSSYKFLQILYRIKPEACVNLWDKACQELARESYS